MSTNPASTTSSVHQNVVPSEVGWQFVPQYYTFVNKQPNRLHCFYTKNSTFIHGTEGEDGRPCYGQQEIHQKILSIGFQDCKVFIHSVDAQASAAGGIIIQVIGEMSNRGEAWRKFVQTFFLAEQPNGYFVLNDIFRFLKEESVEDDDDADDADELQVESEPAPLPVEHQPELEPAPPVNVPAPAPIEVAREPTPELVPEPASVPVEESAVPQPNGVHHDEPEKEAEPVAEPPVEQEQAPGPVPAVREPTPTPAPAPAAAQPSPAPAPVAQPAPITIQPAAGGHSAPKTWANLAATNPKKWGAAVAQESRGMSVEVVTPLPPPPRSGTQTPVSAPATNTGAGRGAHHGPKGGRESHPAYQQAMAVTTCEVFVKGITEPSFSVDDLRGLLEKHGGKTTEVEIVRSRACAFARYEELESAKKAIIASLNAGGIRVDVGQEHTLRINIETKKERGERPPPRGPRGGGPQSGDRGGFRGRGRGRGIPSGKVI